MISEHSYRIQIRYVHASQVRLGDVIKFGGLPYRVAGLKANEDSVEIVCDQAFDSTIHLSVEIAPNTPIKVFKEYWINTITKIE